MWAAHEKEQTSEIWKRVRFVTISEAAGIRMGYRDHSLPPTSQ